MMMRRRRPLLRAAAVGGTAYAVGRHQGRNAEAGDQQEADQNAQIADLQAQQQQAPAAYAAPPPPSAPASDGLTPENMAQLQQLGDMNKSGVLTDEEFAAAKAKILGHLS